MADFTAHRTIMVDTQIRPSDVTKFPIIDAMLSVAREQFVPDAARQTAYRDGLIALGDGRAMLEPRTLAKMLDVLDISRDDLVLDIGCGLGYSAAVIARMAEAVVAVEENEDLASEAEALLGAADVDNVAVIHGPLVQGAPQHGPYDVIILQGAVQEVPAALTGSLKDSGRIAALFMEGPLGVCRIGHKSNNSVTWRDAFNATAPILPGFVRRPEFQL